MFSAADMLEPARVFSIQVLWVKRANLCERAGCLSMPLSEDAGIVELICLGVQVSEDHCWLNTDPEGERAGTIEITTDSAVKRALPVDAAAWQGWLYSGGHAPLCSHKVPHPPIHPSTHPSLPFPHAYTTLLPPFAHPQA